MSVVKGRLQRMFFLLAISADYVRSKELAEYTGLSERTVKNEIPQLQLYLQDCGCKLLSKKGKGYKLEIYDDDKYQETKVNLEIRFANNDFFKKSNDLKTNDIIRYLIIQDDYIKLDDLAYSMNVSRSSIKYDLREVRQLLEGFNLSLQSKPGYGVKVIGKEFALRLCMLEMYEFHYHKAKTDISNNKFLDEFSVEEPERIDIRHTFLKVLRSSGIRLVDLMAQRLSRYFLLQRNRYKKGKYVEFSSQDKNSIKKYKEHTIAENIFTALQTSHGFVVDADEVSALALLLLIWSDLLYSDNMKERYPDIYDEAAMLLTIITAEFDKEWHSGLSSFELYKEIMLTALIPIMASAKYEKMIKYYVTGSIVEENLIRTSPLSIAFAKSFGNYIKTAVNYAINNWELNLLALRFYIIIDQIEYSYTPIKMLVSSRNGIESAKMLKHKIINFFDKKYFEFIEIYNFYEIRALEHTYYDYLILNYPAYSYSYEIPYICINQIPDKEEMASIYSNAILKGYHFPDLLSSFNFDNYFIYKDFEYESKEAFVKLISFKWGKDYDATGKIYEEINSKPNGYIYAGTVTIIINGKLTRQNCINIFKLKKLSSWDNKEIRYIIFLAVDFSNLYQIRFIEHITHELSYSQNNIEKLLDLDKLEGLAELAKKSISII